MALSLFSIEAVLVVLTLFIHMKGAAISSSNVSTDHAALLAIKSKITHDPQGFMKSWNNSLPYCRWQGVTCDRRHQRVIILNLTETGVVGSLSPYVGNLSFLKYFLIQSN